MRRPAPTPRDELLSQRVFGLNFTTGAGAEEVAAWLLQERSHRDGSWRVVVTPNVDHLVRYSANAPERRVAQAAELVLPDGAPVVWASRLLGHGLDRRVTGSDLFDALWPEICTQRRPAVVLAATKAVAAKLSTEHPVGRYVVAPMFDVGDNDTVRAVVDQLVDQILDINAEFVVVGLSMSKHHRLAAELAARTPAPSAPFVLLLGAATDFHTGAARRAPRWMRRAGIEWLHRLAKDPRRLARRYLVDDPKFASLVWHEWRQRSSGEHPRTTNTTSSIELAHHPR